MTHEENKTEIPQRILTEIESQRSELNTLAMVVKDGITDFTDMRRKESDDKRAVDEKNIDTRYKMFLWDRILMTLLIVLIVVLSLFGKFDKSVFGAIILIIGYLLRNELFGGRKKND